MSSDLQIPLFLLTFNCAKLKLNAAEFIDHVIGALPQAACDLYVFGFQEVCSILDGAFPDIVNRHMIEINRILLDTLHEKYHSPSSPYNFTTVGLHHVGAIGMIAISPFGLRFRDCRFADASCGSAHSLLKGGVGLRVKYVPNPQTNIEFTFACSHLNANEGEYYYQRRLKDLYAVMRALDFGDGFSFLKPNCHSFFMGDLNFRTSKVVLKGKPSAALADFLDLHDRSNTSDVSGSIMSLVRKYDELTEGKNKGELFTGFSEPDITFQPTYKYYLDTAIYNTKRCPLWCDRILFQNTYKVGHRPHVYKYLSIDTYKRSDHRPVYLHLSVPYIAPESIIGESGFLVVVPNTSPRPHSSDFNFDQANEEIVSGPTLTFMKCTSLDKINQIFFRRVSDLFIGYGLWFGTTPKGRLLLLGFSLLMWVAYYILSK